MANLALHQALTPEQQKAIKRANLDCLVKYIDRFIYEDAHLFGLEGLIYRHGMPGKFPTGEWGYTLVGDAGVFRTPEPDPMDHRISYRSPEIPIYSVEYSTLHRVSSKITDYYGRNQMDMVDPKMWIAFHLAALARSIPKYLKAVLYMAFAGAKVKQEKWAIKEWIDTYIKPANGNTDGYKFYLSGGFEEINLQKVITKQKITDHKLDKALDDINKALRNDVRKVEIDMTKDEFLKTAWVKDNVTPAGKKVIALINGIENELKTLLRNNRFDEKYKHKKESFDGFHPHVDASNLAIIISSTDVATLMKEGNLKEPYSGSFMTRVIGGVGVWITDLFDPGEALIMHKDLIQAHIMPAFSRYLVDPYRIEQTTDYIYEMVHTFTLVDVHGSIYLKLKD